MDELARLKWQCRRGTKELDKLLNRYLETGYLAADQQEKALFVELLKLEDDRLMAVLMGNLEVAGMGVLVGKVRAFAFDSQTYSPGKYQEKSVLNSQHEN
ncbi:MAG: succinate dehydrogenase assembly factor 2 [Methylobacter sp.]|nr:succinate dehydrogenase assembly factor 2 [Methylobacter sp.]MDP2428228.1 succinate dehydrogenase assembly factor 2 [Methylobacter sp.]MDP3053741.1 succinate dehydrogenase assembly factor 2 [Methylobacter sp.]MDP3362288.1 succinate dehydrogenase assembly factor 2 [Methylobacter sp.]MDZ4218274.1 succinate dehydrogenase assembly factor 2 [Methylobacter sp.]